MTSLLMLTVLSFTAQDPYEDGAKVFKLSCAQGYCHGSGGTQGRAPKLIGRAYEPDAARRIIENGVPGTGMPAFKERLDAAQLNSVLFFVVKVSGGDPSKIGLASGGSAKRQVPPEVARGKAAFFDALKSVNRCSTCHALEDIGLAVGANLSSGGPFTVAAIRAGKDASVRMITADGESFPGVLADQKGEWARVYDLTVSPPVLRTFPKSQVKWAGGSEWRHSAAVKVYSDAELEDVAAYLKWVGER